jgi:hypothetical protein
MRARTAGARYGPFGTRGSKRMKMAACPANP